MIVKNHHSRSFTSRVHLRFVSFQSWCLGGATARGLQSPTHQTRKLLHLAVHCSNISVCKKLLLCITVPTASGLQISWRLQFAAFMSMCLSVINFVLPAKNNSPRWPTFCLPPYIFCLNRGPLLVFYGTVKLPNSYLERQGLE